MNVLIVDDEYLIVQGIQKNTDWERLGVDRVFCAYSVKQAQNIFRKEKVDVLLTDIEMPKESGLELIEWVRAKEYRTICLMLTGYQDFNYAQQALNMQAFRYILKPVETIALEEALEKAINASRTAAESEKAITNSNAWNEKKDYMIQAFWKDLFLDKNTNDESKIQNSLNQLGFPESWLREKFCFIRIKVQQKEAGQRKEEKTDFLEKIIRGYTKPEFFISAVSFSGEEYMVICQASFCMDSEEAYEKCVEMLERMQKEMAGCKFTMYLFYGRYLSTAHECYQQFLQYERTFFSVHSIVIPMEGELGTISDMLTEADWEQLGTNQWTEELLRYHSAFILEKIMEYFQNSGGIFPVKMLFSLYHEILKTTFKALESLEDISSEEVIDEFLMKVADCTDVVSATSSAENFMVWAEEVYLAAELILKERRGLSSFMNQVKRIIKEQISSESLSRNTIAEALHMNPDYLSHLFHKQSGELLTTYITKERLSAAKILLLNSD